MKTEIKRIGLFSARWWNPLFWLVVVIAPFLGIVIGALAGCFYGLLWGYVRGLDTSSRKLNKILDTLP